MIKYSKELPPNWKLLKQTFSGIGWDKGVIVTYGGTYHCIKEISDDEIIHEETHTGQQKAWGIDEWWKMYIENPVFRLDQEIEAYKNQISYLRDKMMNISRNERRFRINKYKEYFALLLSSDIYGNMIQYDRALQRIS